MVLPEPVAPENAGLKVRLRKLAGAIAEREVAQAYQDDLTSRRQALRPQAWRGLGLGSGAGLKAETLAAAERLRAQAEVARHADPLTGDFALAKARGDFTALWCLKTLREARRRQALL